MGIALISLNLRPALASVGPVAGLIASDTGLSHAAVGLLTTIPLLAFGVVSTLTPYLTARLGFGGTMTLGLALLAGGTALRAVPAVSLLYGGTVLLGIGIAVGNVLLPGLVKRDFEHRSGLMTSLYSSGMGLGATVAAGLSVPLAARVGWRLSLGLWAVPAALAFIAWLPQLTSGRYPDARPSLDGADTSLRRLGRSRLAWQIALYMGLQSLAFYVILAWLPAILQVRGYTASEAGWLLAVSQATGVLGTALVPVFAARHPHQRGWVWALGVLEAASLAGLILPPLAGLATLWVGILGFTLGGTFGLSLLFLVHRATGPRSATTLSGMAQSVGYLVAAVGPVAFGLFHDLTGSWLVPLLLLVLALLAKVAAGLGAGSPGKVHEPG